MSKIIINSTTEIDVPMDGVSSVNFNYFGEKIYAAKKIESIVGVFVSQPIWGEDTLVSWEEASWVAQKFEGMDVYVYIRSSSSIADLLLGDWVGPYLNTVNDISVNVGRFLQFMIVLINNGVKNTNYQYLTAYDSPIFSDMSLTYLSSSNAAKFFTRSYNLGFIPKHILLTYNGEVPVNSVLRFAVSGFDSVNSSDYQYIDPNKIEELSELSTLSNQIKVMIEMTSDKTIPIVINEFALMFSGDNQLMLNEESSSQSSSTSSMDFIILDTGEEYYFPVSNQKVMIEYIGNPGETATVVLNETYTYAVGNISGSFVWDIGGLNEHTFIYLGESITQLAGSRLYTVIWDGFGSLLFSLELRDRLSSSSESSSGSLESSSSFSFSSSSSSSI